MISVAAIHMDKTIAFEHPTDCGSPIICRLQPVPSSVILAVFIFLLGGSL
jgi:hypothetical protein